jgi:exonuclease VII large subunit
MNTKIKSFLSNPQRSFTMPNFDLNTNQKDELAVMVKELEDSLKMFSKQFDSALKNATNDNDKRLAIKSSHMEITENYQALIKDMYMLLDNEFTFGSSQAFCHTLKNVRSRVYKIQSKSDDFTQSIPKLLNDIPLKKEKHVTFNRLINNELNQFDIIRKALGKFFDATIHENVTMVDMIVKNNTIYTEVPTKECYEQQSSSPLTGNIVNKISQRKNALESISDFLEKSSPKSTLTRGMFNNGSKIFACYEDILFTIANSNNNNWSNVGELIHKKAQQYNVKAYEGNIIIRMKKELELHQKDNLIDNNNENAPPSPKL